MIKTAAKNLAAGAAVSQIVLLLTAPILTRHYAPNDFGVLSLYTSISTLVLVVASLRYELAIPLPEQKATANNVLFLCANLLMVVVLFVAIALYASKTLLKNLFNTDLIELMLYLLPITIALLGANSILSYWSLREKKFHQITASQMAQAIITSAGQIFFAGSGVVGLLSGQILGQIVAFLILSAFTINKQMVGSFSYKEMAIVAEKYKNFPKYSVWGAFLNTASWQGPIFMIGLTQNQSTIGIYALSMRVIQLPMSVIGSAIGQAFFSYGVQSNRDGMIGALTTKTFKSLLSLSLFPAMLFALIAPDVFQVVFGENWREAGVYTQILMPWAVIWFISSPLSQLYTIMESQKREVGIHLAIFCARMLAILVGSCFADPKVTIEILSVAGVVSYGYLLIQLFKLAAVKYREIFKIVFSNLLICSVVCLCFYYFQVIFSGQRWITMSLAAVLIVLFSVIRITEITERFKH